MWPFFGHSCVWPAAEQGEGSSGYLAVKRNWFFSLVPADYRHNPALPGWCWIWAELWKWRSHSPAEVSDAAVHCLCLVLCTSMDLPAANVPPALPWLPTVKPQPGPCSPEWFQSLSLTLSQTFLLPFPGTVLTEAGGWECELPWAGIQGAGNALQGWASGISVSQVGTIQSCHCWADVGTRSHLHAKVSNPLLVGASKVDYLVFKSHCKVEKLPSLINQE